VNLQDARCNNKDHRNTFIDKKTSLISFSWL